MVSLEVLTPANIDAVLAVQVAPDQDHLVGSVARSLAEAYVHPDLAWPRAVVDDAGTVVGFVMVFMDYRWRGDAADVRSGLWRLNIDAGQQGKGYGAFAVRAVCEELRSRGNEWCWVTYHLGERTPEPFYLGLGFELTGEIDNGETVARLRL